MMVRLVWEDPRRERVARPEGRRAHQVVVWLMASFVEEPQTNGVVERFNRTLKEQVVYGRTFRNIDEVRTAMLDFRHAYNRFWRLGKLRFMTPLEAWQHYENQCPRLAAA